jgi:hypothetical protein
VTDTQDAALSIPLELIDEALEAIQELDLVI